MARFPGGEMTGYRFSKEFKDKFKKINAWSKAGEVFSISPAAAEKKFRNV